ncbi:MAG: hypothetical protein HY040_02080, partial [Planctomycetes bacterium]|nr:hypothetical protein [Planctomycetota bacterium]
MKSKRLPLAELWFGLAKLRRAFVVCSAVIISVATIALVFAQTRGTAAEIAGKVQIAGSPVTGSTVILYAASEGAPVQLAQAKTSDDGTFKLDSSAAAKADGKVLYVLARGGTPEGLGAKGPNDAIALLAVLGTKLPKTVTINELTTVASTFTA